MRRKGIWTVIALMLILACARSFACADVVISEAMEHLIHEALLATMPPEYYPDSEYFTEEHAILGTQEKGDTLEIYLSASVGGYGFMGGGFLCQNGWGGPCTVVLERTSSGWAHKETLEIEDYSEIPDIMPKWAEERYFAGDAQRSNEIDDQLHAYLTSIGRTEPIVDYAQAGGELPNILVHASNMTSPLRDDYPLGVTTKERLEDGVRMLYVNTWSPDEDGVVDPVYDTEKGRLNAHGTTGTQVLQRVRKDDGKVFETITMRSELYRLSITVEDDYGSIEYVLPYDGWDYRQPTVTRTGACRVDVARFEQKCAELEPADGAAPDTQILGVEQASDRERFVIVREAGKNVLIFEQYRNGLWQDVWRNPGILPDTPYDWISLHAYPERGPQLHEYGRFSAYREETLSIYAGYEGEEHGDLDVQLERGADGAWQVTSYSDDTLHLYLFDEQLLYYAADFSAMHTAGLSFEHMERDAQRFAPEQARIRRDDFADRLSGAVNVEYFAGAEPLYISPGRKVQCPVYTAPDPDAPRAGGGKAAVSLNDWVALLGREEGWLLALYEIGQGRYRMGWIKADEDQQLMEAAAYVMPLRYEDAYQTVLGKRGALFDDPINGQGEFAQLPAGQAVTVLEECFIAAGDVHEIAYVETELDGCTVRGFVGMRCLKSL